MSDMEHTQADHTLLEMIEIISSKRHTGRLEIAAAATGGAFFFKDGKLLDAELGSLTGFQAVNAALSIRDAQFSFNPLISMPASSSITPNERIVLKRFFGIDCAELQESYEDASVTDVDWEVTPEPVVPLSEVEEVNGIHRGFLFAVSRPRIALFLTLLLTLTAGAIALTLKVNERRNQAVVAETTASPSAPATQTETSQLAETTQQSDQHQQQAEPQNLTGEWTIVNTVDKTAYRAFDDLKIGFRLVINQTGREFTAKGEKVSENGRSLPVRDRTPIQVVGSIDGDKIVATFVEDGAKRKTNGRFVWRIQGAGAGAGLTGTFASDAARSSGRSAATKVL